jgi:hypothetical protein
MQTDPYADLVAFRPRMLRERPLSVGSRSDRLGCRGEDDEESVTLGVDLLAVVSLEDRSQQSAMIRKEASVRVPGAL